MRVLKVETACYQGFEASERIKNLRFAFQMVKPSITIIDLQINRRGLVNTILRGLDSKCQR